MDDKRRERKHHARQASRVFLELNILSGCAIRYVKTVRKSPFHVSEGCQK